MTIMRHFVAALLFVCPFVSVGDCLYDINDDLIGRRFDGIGAISGGSATSKLLVNYPEKQRSEILDFLFKPHFGASLQICKVEIGGDSQAAGGTESSHMHEPWDENYQRGYEWWVMSEAKKRNPSIKLYGLPWSFPGWVGQGSDSPYKNPNVTASYVLKWILGAKKYHNLDIDYIGIWNEQNYDITYVETLKSELKRNNLSSIQVVVADGEWGVSDDVLRNPAFASAVDIIGVHYPGTLTTDASLRTNKTLWSSEDYSTFNDNTGAGCWARILNQNYVNGYMTSTISWNLIASYYPSLPLWNRQGLMTAQEPWSGYYVVESPIWATAHTTQFTEIGWSYLKHGSGVQKLDNGGSFVTFASPDRKIFTIVIETMTHNHSQCIRPELPPYNVTAQNATFRLAGNLSSIRSLNVWRTVLAFDGKQSSLFKKLAPIKTKRGKFMLYLEPDQIYTLTTLSSGNKGKYPTPPSSKSFPFPYRDNFEDYPEFSEMNNFAAQNGVFEVRRTSDNAHGKVNRQVMLHEPIYWCENRGPTLNLGGNSEWTELVIFIDAFVPSVNGTDGVFVAAAVGPGGCGVSSTTGYFYTFFPRTGVYVTSLDIMRKHVLLNGTYPPCPDTWFTLQIVLRPSNVTGFINSKRLFSIDTYAPVTKGFAAYGTTTYGYADFDNLFITGPRLSFKEFSKKRFNTIAGQKL